MTGAIAKGKMGKREQGRGNSQCAAVLRPIVFTYTAQSSNHTGFSGQELKPESEKLRLSTPSGTRNLAKISRHCPSRRPVGLRKSHPCPIRHLPAKADDANTDTNAINSENLRTDNAPICKLRINRFLFMIPLSYPCQPPFHSFSKRTNSCRGPAENAESGFRFGIILNLHMNIDPISAAENCAPH